jgi:hypothetical protein
MRGLQCDRGLSIRSRSFLRSPSGESVGVSICGQPDCKFIRDIEQPCISRFSIVLNAENSMGQAKVIAINHLAWLALPRLMSGIQRHFSVSRFYFAIVEVF